MQTSDFLTSLLAFSKRRLRRGFGTLEPDDLVQEAILAWLERGQGLTMEKSKKLVQNVARAALRRERLAWVVFDHFDAIEVIDEAGNYKNLNLSLTIPNNLTSVEKVILKEYLVDVCDLKDIADRHRVSLSTMYRIIQNIKQKYVEAFSQ